MCLCYIKTVSFKFKIKGILLIYVSDTSKFYMDHVKPVFG